MCVLQVKMKVRRFFVKISEDNAASIALFEKCGFVRCGYVACFKEVELEWFAPDVAEKPSELVNVRPFSSPTPSLLPSPPAAPTTEATPAARGPAQAPSAVEPRLKVATFGAVVGDGMVNVSFSGQILLMQDSCVVSLVPSSAGAGPAQMGALCVAMSSRFEPMPLASGLLEGASCDGDIPAAIAKHLAKRSGRQCFVSSSLPDNAALFVPEIVAHITSAIASIAEPSKTPAEVSEV